MFNRVPISARVVLAGVLLTACSASPTAPTEALPAEANEVSLMMDDLSTQAAGRGDDRAASAYAGTALALRFGAIPTEIAVEVDGVETRYLAVVTGILRHEGGAPRLHERTLVAWTAQGTPRAILQVESRGDEGNFAQGSANPAHGIWADLRAQERHEAVEGSVVTTLGSTAGRCPNQPSGRDPAVTCQLARFASRLSGTFVESRDPTRRVTIGLEAQSIAGVVLARAGGGDPIRPPTISDPVPQRLPSGVTVGP